LPVVGQEFFFAGTCLPSCSLATDINVTVHRPVDAVVDSNRSEVGKGKKMKKYSRIEVKYNVANYALQIFCYLFIVSDNTKRLQ
jgi:hypothetical protein